MTRWCLIRWWFADFCVAFLFLNFNSQRKWMKEKNLNSWFHNFIIAFHVFVTIVIESRVNWMPPWWIWSLLAQFSWAVDSCYSKLSCYLLFKWLSLCFLLSEIINCLLFDKVFPRLQWLAVDCQLKVSAMAETVPSAPSPNTRNNNSNFYQLNLTGNLINHNKLMLQWLLGECTRGILNVLFSIYSAES